MNEARHPSRDDDAVVVTGIGPMCADLMSVDALSVACDASLRPPATHPWFDSERMLGPRGFKYMTPATKYVLAACARALNDADRSERAYAPVERGVAVGSNFAVHEVLAQMDRVLLDAGSDALQPIHAPNFSVNIPASQISIRHDFRAFNVSFTDAVVAGLQALMFAVRAIAHGRARQVVVAATEDVCSTALANGSGQAQGDGACALILESAAGARGRAARSYGQLAAASTCFLPRDSATARRRYREVITDALVRLRLPERGRLALGYVAAADPSGAEVEALLRAQLRELGLDVADLAPGLRHYFAFSVSPLLHVAAALTRGESSLVAASSPQGHLTMVLLQRSA